MKLDYKNKEELINIVLNRARLDRNNLLALYQYGSRVYGNFTHESDYDFIAVVKKKRNEQFSDRAININFFTKEGHQQRLDNHEISALEAYFCPKKFILIEKQKFNFKLSLKKLRHSLSGKSSNSFVKAKKKLTVEKDYDLNIGKKSLWHSFRIINYGIQIIKHGRIANYDSMNYLFTEVMNNYTWQDLFKKYKTEYNELMSEFRLLAPK